MTPRNLLTLLIIVALLALIIAKLVQNARANQVCGSNPPGDLVGPPSVSAQAIYQVFNGKTPLGGSTGVNVPAELTSMAAAQHLYDDSFKYQIDDAFALADWQHESSYGTAGVATQTKNIGNITITDLNPQDWITWTPPPIGVVPANGLNFPMYRTWLDGIDAWFQRVKAYANSGITDVEHFALYYDLGVTSTNGLTASQMAEIKSYVDDLNATISSWRRAQASVRQPTGTGSAFASTSVNQLPPGNWATPAALQGADQLGLFNCTQPTSMAGAAMNMAKDLTGIRTDGGLPYYGSWAPDTPAPPAETLTKNGVAVSDTGVVWCVEFVSSVYRDFTGKDLPARGDAWTWWGAYQGLPGFQEIAASKSAVGGVPGGLPKPGDIVVLWDSPVGHAPGGGLGHVAVVVGVQPPAGTLDGFIIIAQGHATSVLDKWTISASTWTVDTGWSYHPIVKGYIRLAQQ